MNRHHHRRLCPVGRAREDQIKQCRGLSCGKPDTRCKHHRFGFFSVLKDWVAQHFVDYRANRPEKQPVTCLL